MTDEGVTEAFVNTARSRHWWPLRPGGHLWPLTGVGIMKALLAGKIKTPASVTMAVRPDSFEVAAGLWNAKIRVVSFLTNKVVNAIDKFINSSGPDSYYDYDIAYFSDGKRIVAGTSGRGIYVLDTERSCQGIDLVPMSKRKKQADVQQVVCHPDGKMIVTKQKNPYNVTVWHINDGAKKTFRSPNNVIASVSVGCNGDFMTIGTRGAQELVTTYRTDTWTQAGEADQGRLYLQKVAMNPVNDKIIVCGMCTKGFTLSRKPGDWCLGKDYATKDIAFTNDGSMAAVLVNCGPIMVWELSTNMHVVSINRLHGKNVRKMEFSPCNNLLFVLANSEIYVYAFCRSPLAEVLARASYRGDLGARAALIDFLQDES